MHTGCASLNQYSILQMYSPESSIPKTRNISDTKSTGRQLRSLLIISMYRYVIVFLGGSPTLLPTTCSQINLLKSALHYLHQVRFKYTTSKWKFTHFGCTLSATSEVKLLRFTSLDHWILRWIDSCSLARPFSDLPFTCRSLRVHLTIGPLDYIYILFLECLPYFSTVPSAQFSLPNACFISEGARCLTSCISSQLPWYGTCWLRTFCLPGCRGIIKGKEPCTVLEIKSRGQWLRTQWIEGVWAVSVQSLFI